MCCSSLQSSTKNRKKKYSFSVCSSGRGWIFRLLNKEYDWRVKNRPLLGCCTCSPLGGGSDCLPPTESGVTKASPPGPDYNQGPACCFSTRPCRSHQANWVFRTHDVKKTPKSAKIHNNMSFITCTFFNHTIMQINPEGWKRSGHAARMDKKNKWMENLTECDRLKCVSIDNEIPRHEGVWGTGCIVPRILNLGTRSRWMVSFKLRQFYSRE
jgi:hypothetical protein